MVYGGEEVPELGIILDKVETTYIDEVESKIEKLKFIDAHTIKTSTTHKQPGGLKTGLNLYKYQLDAVSWMKSIENNSEGEHEIDV